MLTVATFCYGMKYGREYVDRLEAGVRRNLSQPYRFVVITEAASTRKFSQTTWEMPAEDLPLLEVPGCFCRLRLFDPYWQASHGIKRGDRIVCLDLDLIVTGRLEPLFDRPEPFIILGGANASNPCPYNGSIWSLVAGNYARVWSDFSIEAAAKIPYDSFPDDQAWMYHKIPNAAVWPVGPESGVFAFQKPRWPGGDDLPSSARIVAFPGKRDPSQFTKLPWVRKHWIAG